MKIKIVKGLVGYSVLLIDGDNRINVSKGELSELDAGTFAARLAHILDVPINA